MHAILEDLQISMIMEHKLSFLEMEELFFNEFKISLFRSYQERILDYLVSLDDYAWNVDEAITIGADGRIGGIHTWQSLGCSFRAGFEARQSTSLLELDMPYFYGYFNEKYCRLDFGKWAKFVKNEIFQRQVLNIARELCLEFGTNQILAVPFDLWETYSDFGDLKVVEAMDLVATVPTLSGIVNWLEEHQVQPFNRNDLNCYMLKSL